MAPNTKMPFSVEQSVDHQPLYYVATKKANELRRTPTHLHAYRLPVTGLRFFAVYGSLGSPHMALFLFTKSILRAIRLMFSGSGRRLSLCATPIEEGMRKFVEWYVSTIGSFSVTQVPLRGSACGSFDNLTHPMTHLILQYGRTTEVRLKCRLVLPEKPIAFRFFTIPMTATGSPPERMATTRSDSRGHPYRKHRCQRL
jgi:hypothetical protein